GATPAKRRITHSDDGVRRRDDRSHLHEPHVPRRALSVGRTRRRDCRTRVGRLLHGRSRSRADLRQAQVSENVGRRKTRGDRRLSFVLVPFIGTRFETVAPMLTTLHGEAEDAAKERWAEGKREEVRQSREQTRRERDEAPQERHAEERTRRQGRKGEEPKAGDRHWPVRGPQEGREGSAEEKRQETSLKQSS